ncbi:MAG: response regulator transcription factor [Ginsengibacter sp.]
MPEILLVDNHPVVITGLKTVINTFLPHCKTDSANNGDTVFQKIKYSNYDLIIIGISLPYTNSFKMISDILAIKPGAKILMFSINSTEIFAKKYLKMGAIGYLNKDASLNEIKTAIDDALQNKGYKSQALKEKFAKNGVKDDDCESEFDKLSLREFEIVGHLAHGQSISEISGKLNLHTSTVGTHKARIFEKLHCHNIIELATMAKVHHIIL